MKNVISIKDFEKKDFDFVFSVAEDIEKNPTKYNKIHDGKVISSIFYEPSTRTRLSFDSAIKKLGGSAIGFSDTTNSSVKKGETFLDTIKMVAAYSDLIVTRTNIEGAPRIASESTDIPVINAGDGKNQHPTQTFLDLYTIKKEKGSLENLSIGFLGDLKYGRTVHSLLQAIILYKPKKIKLIAHTFFQIDQAYLDLLKDNNIDFEILEDIADNLKDLDVLYVTRTQIERIADAIDLEPLKKRYTLTKEILDNSNNPNLIVMHPLPRIYEITTDVDFTPYACYFKQAKNGVPIRQALICVCMGLIKYE
jgi:aspartate carbamoyltransferase catalytic subunit